MRYTEQQEKLKSAIGQFNDAMDAKHTIDCDGLKPFQIWNDKGKVRQNGRLMLPEFLAEFNNDRSGRLQAGAYISGILAMQRIMKGQKP